MNDDKQKSVDTKLDARKETYTAEEKQIIIDNLNEERRINQKIVADLSNSAKHYNKSDKNKILNKLNQQRLSREKREAIKKKRTYNKEIYTFGDNSFYKLIQMEKEYYIRIEDCEQLTSQPNIISLYYKIFDALKKKDVLMKVEAYSDKFFISYDVIRVYFKPFALENVCKK